jgi:hypothetical protein
MQCGPVVSYIARICLYLICKAIVMKKLVFGIVFLCLQGVVLNAQTSVRLTIKHLYGVTPFSFTATAQNSLGQDFKLTRVDYYISGIKIIHDGGMQTAVPNHYILAKGDVNVIDDLGTYSNINAVEGIKFSVGVDFPNNNADITLWPQDHPLSFQSPSMHWGWSSGYRFIALEGLSGAGLSKVFQMHALDNANYIEQTVMAPGVAADGKVYINLDADFVQALHGVDVSAGPIDHGTNQTDLAVLLNFHDRVFKAGAGLPAAVTGTGQGAKISIFPNPSSGKINIVCEGLPQEATQAVITDVYGREVQRVDLRTQKSTAVVQASQGLYLISIFQDTKVLTTQKLFLN